MLPVYLQKSHLPNQTWLSGDLAKLRFSFAVWVSLDGAILLACAFGLILGPRCQSSFWGCSE